MNKAILFSAALLAAPALSHAMEGGSWLKMRPKDATSGLFVRQEFCFATGTWIDEMGVDGQTEDWLWDPAKQRYMRANALNHKDFRKKVQESEQQDHEHDEKKE